VKENRRALVIDDDPDIAEVLTTLLEVRGFEVDVVNDGIHALEPKFDYDVVLLDLKMPVFDGERLSDYWLTTRPELLDKVIVLSGYSKFTRGRELPTFASVTKPFDFDLISELIDECARKPSERRTPVRIPNGQAN